MSKCNWREMVGSSWHTSTKHLSSEMRLINACHVYTIAPIMRLSYGNQFLMWQHLNITAQIAGAILL